MNPIYRIHPGVGIARLGNSPTSFYIGPERAAQLPFECDDAGNPRTSDDGVVHVTEFKDSEGRIRRQAARFAVWVYDDESPEGRPLKLGDPIRGGGNAGKLVEIRWRVWLANKKAVWYEFEQLDGEHGYPDDHGRRNPQVKGANARQRLIIDPGPRVVDSTKNRRASFDRDGGVNYSPTFPPPLKPHDIDTLGDLLTDDEGRLLVLGGHGNSGSYLFDDFGQPRIDNYANNDGWFDDTSDGPVMARLVMESEVIGGSHRVIDVESPAWVICAYPRYVPEILDIVTMDDVLEDLAITQFASRPDLYGPPGSFDKPSCVDPTDTEALVHWRAGALRWNGEWKPWFWRDVWSILFRPDQYSYLCDILGQSNYPHNYSTRGTFDPFKLAVPPKVYRKGVEKCQRRCIERHLSGETFVETLAPAYLLLQKEIEAERRERGKDSPECFLTDDASREMAEALAEFAKAVHATPAQPFDAFVSQWRAAADEPSLAAARTTLEERLNTTIKTTADSLGLSQHLRDDVERITREHLRKYQSGRLLDECSAKCVEANTNDPYRAMRLFLFSLIRKPGEENDFVLDTKPSSRVHNLPLMPLLAGDNPISNVLPSKFLRLTEYQYYVLRQWASGKFYNEAIEGWPMPNPWWPYTDAPPATAREIDRGVLANILGGAFCPGGEVGWVMRNPAIWSEPYRINADRDFSDFSLTGASANTGPTEAAYLVYELTDLSQDNDFSTGLQPGDLTKYMSCPWQSDYNECSTQTIDVTYEEWNELFADSTGDALMTREQRAWETLWWPAHRPMQTFEAPTRADLGQSNWMDWTPGVPQTNAGDLKMVTEWWRLPFVIRNPNYDFTKKKPTSVPPPNPPPYVSFGRTPRKAGDGK